MYKKTFEIELVLNEGHLNELFELYVYISKDGPYENFDQFLEDAISFRLIQHIKENANFQKDFIRHFTDLQPT